MQPEPSSVATRVTLETGLSFTASQGIDSERHRWVELVPEGHERSHSFALRTTVGWRELILSFSPGNFASELIEAMSAADDNGRGVFIAVLNECRRDGAEIRLLVNERPIDFADTTLFAQEWRNMSLLIRRGMLAINTGDDLEDERLVLLWTGRLAAAILALLPLEPVAPAEIVFLPEGAKIRVEVNRYERDRRNRAAALAIHGYVCKACDLDMAVRYGPTGVGLIEVHHVTPVSRMGPNYLVNPLTDLIPLCPNCHAIAHRRMEPYAVGEIREMLRSTIAPNP